MTTPADTRLERLALLAALFPNDERLRNAVAMTMGCTDQLNSLNESFRKEVFALPAPGEDTVQWENSVNLALGDVLRWLTQIELALHDLRASLFFRYNGRVKKLAPPSPEEEAAMLAAVEEEASKAHRVRRAQTARNTLATVPAKAPTVAPAALEAPTPPPAPVAKRISALFDGVGKPV